MKKMICTMRNLTSSTTTKVKIRKKHGPNDSDMSDEPAVAGGTGRRQACHPATGTSLASRTDEPVDEYGRPEPAANYVVHIYEQKKFKRTIDRPFTPRMPRRLPRNTTALRSRTHRVAVTGKNDAKPKKSLD